LESGTSFNSHPNLQKRKKTQNILAVRTWSIGVAAVRPQLKTGNKQTALDRSLERVRAPEMRTRMPGFERAPVAKPGDQ
jgi:hypothetical protein